MSNFDEELAECREAIEDAIHEFDPCVASVAMRELAAERSERAARYAYREHHEQ